MGKLLACFFVLTASTSMAAVLSQTVGALGDQVFTSREVWISAALEKVLTSAPGPAAVEIPVGGAEFRKETSTLLLEGAIAKEAEAFKIAQTPESELQAAVAKIEKTVAGAPWSTWGVGADELRRLLRQKLMAKSFAKLKRESMTSLISDAEAQDYFEKNRAKFGALPFNAFKENIKSFLSQQQLEERMQSWSDIIKRKHRVRFFLDEEKPSRGAVRPDPPANG